MFSCALLALCGCDNPDKTAGDYLNLRNSFLDPSQVGRFDMEHPYGYVSPVTWPILDSLAVNDPPDHPWANSELPTPADLVPSTAQYILSAGDVITVSVYELITPGEESAQTREINTDGDVTLDFVGKVHAAGLTADQLRDKVTQILIRNGTMTPPGPHQPGPQVNVDLTDAHKQVFSIIGAATHPGTYNISAPDFRLLDALALSGDLPVQPGMDWLYIIRSVPVAHEQQTTTNSTGQQNQAGTTSSSSILADIANQLGQQSSSSNSSTISPGSGEGQNLPNQTTESPSSKAAGTHFIYTNGAWVQVSNDGGSETPATSPQSATASVSSGPMLYNFANAVQPAQPPLYINQRVIRIPMAALRDGDPRYNIVIMPGDIINIPEVDPTYFYIMGNVNRPGVYTLTGQKITLKMAVAAAGNLGPIAIPRRAELIRRIGNDQEMIIQVNLQMIFDGEEPDIFLKPDDVLNVGTDAFAAALATVRNGFQAAYGFGFTYDRNYYITPTILGN
ncbi:MAG TPA: polysaccharide biosynthesis/export family protein [Phycisphaerae bacterium]|nr:polysaccharide biosynthesis/export family protein [Phycisphaerae bacterium]